LNPLFIADPVQEKMTRGFIKSNAEKYISQDAVIIVDSMNYIKGFRYELYCLARSMKTTNCLLYLNTPYEVCKEYNASHEAFPEAL
jgi:protein KTI12